MINTFIRPQFSMLAAMSKYINKTEEKLIVTSYRKVIKKVVGLNMRIENVIVDKIAGNILDFNKNTYNRILNKLNERFNLNEQDFYQINYEKINHKFIPNNQEVNLRRLGFNKNLKKYTSCKDINLDLEKLIFKGKYKKDIMYDNYEICNKII